VRLQPDPVELDHDWRAPLMTVHRGHGRARWLYDRLGFLPIPETDLHVVME
jgi:hypothetical protein